MTAVRDLRGLRGSILLPLIAIAVTFLVTTPLILLANADPVSAYYAFLIEPFTSRLSAVEVLVKTAPLMLTGISVALAFSAGYYNIGAEGQLLAGAIFGAWLGPMMNDAPPLLAIPLMLAGGAAAGAVWALTPALLKTRLNVDEVVTTLLLNSVMVFLVSGLLNGPWRNPITQMPQSQTIAGAAQFPILIEGARLHLGLLIAIAVVIAYGLLLNHTAFGLRLRAMGQGREAARFLGVNIARTTLVVALLSGAIAGLAGVGEVAGVQHRLIDEISGGYGYAGIIVATLGGFTSIGVALAALFIAMIDNGAQEISRSLGVPTYLADVVQATLLIVTLIALYYGRKK